MIRKILHLLCDVRFAIIIKKRRGKGLNNKQRTKLENIVSELETIVLDEQNKLDNLEENFSGTERYEKIEEGISSLEDAIENIQAAIES